MTRLLRLLAVMVISLPAAAQCPSGTNSASLNWDALEFLRATGSYSPYVTAAAATRQSFAFGTKKAVITHNFIGANNVGINTEHTGETGSNGAGADIQVMGNGTFTVTFDSAVQNVKFSLYDIDVSQRAAITASNGTTAMPVTLSTLSGSILTVTSNNTTSARVDATSTAVAKDLTTGVVNVSITGPLTTFTITLSNTGTVTNGPAANREDGSAWISDISACIAYKSFPTDYFNISKPYSGQPGYVLTAVNNQIWLVDPATGNSKFLFVDAGASNINSVAYDPYNHWLYYTYSLTSNPETDKAVKRYDYSTGTISTAIADVTTLGIPTFENGVESGSAAFYNGSLYLGIEGYNSGVATGRKSIVWRIDFNSTGTATGAAQVYGTAADNGTSTIHDWSDIGINNGILYDFDGAASGDDIYQYNLQTGALTHYTPNGFVPRQVGIDWAGNLYNIDGTVTPYTGTTSINTAAQKTITGTNLPAGASYGDASEGFIPKADFGDAPATYDPVALSPALHELTSNLRIGSAVTDEWSKTASSDATSDVDDGLPTPSIFINNSNYLASVNVYNNTGVPATLGAWVDFNANGTFETGEGITVTVPSKTTVQSIDLFWPTPTTTLVPYSYTFMRIRLTSQSNLLTTAKPTGFMADGEVEDYRVQVNAFALAGDILRFDAEKQGRHGRITWEVADEVPGTQYTLQRSEDGRRWTSLKRESVSVSNPRGSYAFIDGRPATGSNYYRLQVLRPGGQLALSAVRQLQFAEGFQFTLAPNPATDATQLRAEAPVAGRAVFRLFSAGGLLVHEAALDLLAGSSARRVPLPATLPPGTYFVEIRYGGERFNDRLLIHR